MPWTCAVCTVINEDSAVDACAVCMSPPKLPVSLEGSDAAGGAGAGDAAWTCDLCTADGQSGSECGVCLSPRMAKSTPSPPAKVASPAKAAASAPVKAAAAAAPASPFSRIDRLCSMILEVDRKCKLDDIKAELAKPGLNVNSASSTGKQPVFFAVRAERRDVLDLLVKHDADVNIRSTDAPPQTPLQLALTLTTDDMLRDLLARGADISVVADRNAPELSFCARYWLRRAAGSAQATPEALQQMKKLGLARLNEVLMSVVGQELAARMVLASIASTRVLAMEKPKVIVFAGPPGHGKTVLSERLGEAVFGSKDFIKVACERIQSSMELIGAAHPYVGADKGSNLNNFLTTHSDKEGLVLLDEVEKMPNDAIRALLNILEKGQYEDKRNGKAVRCHKIVFILTTNILDNRIKAYFRDHPEMKETKDQKQLTHFFDELRTEFETRIGNDGPALGRRCDAFCPFVPFSRPEAVVIADQCLRQPARQLIKEPPKERKDGLGKCKIFWTDRVVRFLASRYREDNGAGSIASEVERWIVLPLSESFALAKLKKVVHPPPAKKGAAADAKSERKGSVPPAAAAGATATGEGQSGTTSDEGAREGETGGRSAGDAKVAGGAEAKSAAGADAAAGAGAGASGVAAAAAAAAAAADSKGAGGVRWRTVAPPHLPEDFRVWFSLEDGKSVTMHATEAEPVVAEEEDKDEREEREEREARAAAEALAKAKEAAAASAAAAAAAAAAASPDAAAVAAEGAVEPDPFAQPLEW